MTRIILTVPLLAATAISACARNDCDPRYRFVNELTGEVICTGPTGAVTASGPDDRDRARAERPEKPERPTEPEKEPEHDPEPDREKDEKAHDDWKDRQK